MAFGHNELWLKTVAKKSPIGNAGEGSSQSCDRDTQVNNAPKCNGMPKPNITRAKKNIYITIKLYDNRDKKLLKLARYVNERLEIY